MKRSGITLIALIITIIILLILASITITAIFENNIIDMAITGVENYTKSAQDEEDALDEIEDELNEILNPNNGVILSMDKNSISYLKVNAVSDENMSEISSYTFQTSLTNLDEDFKTVEIINSTEKLCNYEYHNLEEGTIHYLRVVVTYKKGKTKTSNLIKACTTKLCTGPFPVIKTCDTCKRKWYYNSK